MVLRKVIRKYFKKLFLHLFTAAIMLLLCRFESRERFYRPDLPEQLCCVGIIDADDTLRYISFEKSYQAEYSDESRYLQDLSFTISSSEEEIFKYQGGLLINKIEKFKIPDSISFEPNVRYYLKAKEKTTPEISAEVIATVLPPEPEFISAEVLSTTLTKPAGCVDILDIRTIKIKISIEKIEDMYYAILVKGWGFSCHPLGPPDGRDFSIFL